MRLNNILNASRDGADDTDNFIKEQGFSNHIKKYLDKVVSVR